MIDIHQMTVMIVDDSIPMCKSIRSMMKLVGYGRRFLYAHSGDESLNLLQKEPADLLMLDYNMPGMSGGEALGHIRGDRKLRDLPVIMVTAEAYMDYVAEVGESEIDAYILKPVTVKLLEEKVSLVVENANNPPPMVAHLRKAREYEGVNNLEAAIQEVELAMKANPKASRPIREMGYYHYKKEDLEEAEKWLLKAAKMNYLDVFAFHYLGEIYVKIDNLEKAIQYYEKAMKISPRQTSRGIDFGKILIQRKKIDKAIRVFDKILTLPGSGPELQEKIADIFIEAGVKEYPVKLLESLINQNGNRWDLYYKLGKLLDDMGDRIKAAGYLTVGAKLNKTNVDIRLRLATIYLALRKPLLAEKPLVEILEGDRTHKEARELLTQCY